MIIWLFASLMLVQCSEEGDKTYPTTIRPDWKVGAEDFMIVPPTDWMMSQDGTSEVPLWALRLDGTAEMPQWTNPDKNEYPTSMTAVIRLTPFLEKYVTDEDMLAAFIGNECRGVATLLHPSGVPLFFVQIKAKDSEEGNVSFRYFSKKNRTVFSSVTSDVNYEVNKVYGTVDEPVFPDFEQSGKYPIYMNVTVQLDPATLPFTPQDGDLFAAFVGDECRGTAIIKEGMKPVYTMEIRGKEAGETVAFKYYSIEKKNIYRAELKTSMKALAAFGTAENPQQLIWIPESSMTAYVTVNNIFLPYVSVDDQVAAFVGNTCCGTGQAVGEKAGVRIYKVVIKGLAGQDDKIRLKYYNHICGYRFETADFLSFEMEGFYGTAEQPKEIPLNLAGKHPLKMQMVCTLPQEQTQYVTDSDILAAFVDGECRGIAQLSEKNGMKMFTLTINGSLSNNEQVILKYYCAKTSYLYIVNNEIVFENGKQCGTVDAPAPLSVSVVVD